MPTSLEMVSAATVNSVWHTWDANRCLMSTSYLGRDNDDLQNLEIKVEHSRTRQTVHENSPDEVIYRIHHSLKDQRTGSVRCKLFFVARHLCQGSNEEDLFF